jgi:hypothetical protein
LLSSPIDIEIETQEEKGVQPNSEPEAGPKKVNAELESIQSAGISQLIAKFNVAPKVETIPLQRRNSSANEAQSNLPGTPSPSITLCDSIVTDPQSQPTGKCEDAEAQLGLEEGKIEERVQTPLLNQEIAADPPPLSDQHPLSMSTEECSVPLEHTQGGLHLDHPVKAVEEVEEDPPQEKDTEGLLEDFPDSDDHDDDVSVSSSASGTKFFRHTKSLEERTHGHLLSAPVTVFGRKKSAHNLSDPATAPHQHQRRSFTTPPRSVSFASGDNSPSTSPKRDESGMIIPSDQLAKYISIHKQQRPEQELGQEEEQTSPSVPIDSPSASSLTREEMILRREPFKSFRKLIQATEDEVQEPPQLDPQG